MALLGWGALGRSEANSSVPDTQLTPRLPYPDGWFALATSGEVPPGGVVTRRLAGADVVLYRTRSGRLRAIEPYCPHLGAHLGHGGAVEGEEIVCPFHRFRFDADGGCVATGYGTPPPRARLTGLECRELDGMIFVWRHSLGEPPSWEIETLPPAGFAKPYCGRHVRLDHPQEVMENIVDYGHFYPIHGYHHEVIEAPMFEGERLETTSRLRTEGSWLKVASTTPASKVVIQGLGVVRVQVESEQFGGFRARAWFCVTPVDPLHVEIRSSVALRCDNPFVHRLAPLIARAYVWAAWRDTSEDVPIWQNKIYLERPRLAKGDGPIMPFRRWARQFYTEPHPAVPTRPPRPRPARHSGPAAVGDSR
ncbi:aromatic ring-hydroxylating oxygenase subunit alpha [Streptomyces buecherae]|uniref:aromatic ring-hydroxylating oxygenase subunit alpha n=1 Tax=Streptomyces buecherae TaxID=2763006 RepID=UPI00365CAB01